MSLYRALPPTQGSVSAASAASSVDSAAVNIPAAAAAAQAPRSLLVPRPPVPRALLNLPVSRSKPPSSSPASLPLTSSSASAQPVAKLVSSPFDATAGSEFELESASAASEGDDAELLRALASVTDLYDPRVPNEWEQYLAWKQTQAAEQADEQQHTHGPTGSRLRRRASDSSDDEDEASDGSGRQKRQQLGSHYHYQYEADNAPQQQSPPFVPPSAPPPPPAAVAATSSPPLSVKQDMLAVASGEDAYLRRMRLSSQQPPQPHLPQPRLTQPSASFSSSPTPPPLPPPPPPSSSLQSGFSPANGVGSSAAASRVILLTVVHALLPHHSTAAVAVLLLLSSAVLSAAAAVSCDQRLPVRPRPSLVCCPPVRLHAGHGGARGGGR